MEHEIKFISLPSAADLARNARSTTKLTDEAVGRYEHALHVSRQAHRNAAVIAARFLRPEEYAEHNGQRREAVHAANEKFADAMLAVFSETCTKGF